MGQKVIVALYDHYSDARAAVSDIIRIGTPAGEIALLANDSNGDHPGLSINPAYAREQFDEDSQRQSRYITLGEAGVGVGGVIGFLATISPVAIPGVAAISAQGVWIPAVAAAVLGGIVGAAVGAWTDHGISPADKALYAEGLKRGATLVTATVDDGLADKAMELMRTHGGVRVEARLTGWTAEGWVSLDVGHAPLLRGLATA